MNWPSVPWNGYAKTRRANLWILLVEGLLQLRHSGTEAPWADSLGCASVPKAPLTTCPRPSLAALRVRRTLAAKFQHEYISLARQGNLVRNSEPRLPTTSGVPIHYRPTRISISEERESFETTGRQRGAAARDLVFVRALGVLPIRSATRAPFGQFPVPRRPRGLPRAGEDKFLFLGIPNRFPIEIESGAQPFSHLPAL